MTLEQIKKKAAKNAKERLALIDAMQDLVQCDKIEKRINKVDRTFVRKLYGFPGDITAHRIATVINKIGELHSFYNVI